VCHQKPDGDCLGSGFALYAFAEFLKKNVDIVSDSPVPQNYDFLPLLDKLNMQKHKKYDTVFAMDCAESLRMGKFADYAKSTPVSVNIDHHKTNEYFCKINHVIPELSSTCEVLYDIFEKEGIFEKAGSEISKVMAQCLLVGFSTDTGHFMHSSVTSRTLLAAAKLCEMGASISEIASKIYRTNSLSRTRLLARAIDSMRFFENESICIITLMLNDFEKAGVEAHGTEGIIDVALNLKNTSVAVMIVEQNQTAFKIGFRSKGVDVASVASVFNGGGHTRASGCLIQGRYEDVVDKIIKSVKDFS
ncbi:MAG: bifunctional oligoribonuclease/PAP phosphatase NrnA, partial [Firmicutes bacterium]|nr:bifunctional oligoribonuclease/PAP phosphatase NrnA [Bacillota bacterium]